MIRAMQHGPATPPEIQEQANAYALELWRALRNDAVREGVLSEEELGRIKSKVLHSLALAFSRGSLVVMTAGVESLEKILKTRGKKRQR